MYAKAMGGSRPWNEGCKCFKAGLCFLSIFDNSRKIMAVPFQVNSLQESWSLGSHLM